MNHPFSKKSSWLNKPLKLINIIIMQRQKKLNTKTIRIEIIISRHKLSKVDGKNIKDSN
jgi:hypothetical protein